MHYMTEDFKHFLDAMFGGLTIASIFDLLPHLSAILSIIWFVYRIYESRTTQKLHSIQIERLLREEENEHGV